MQLRLPARALLLFLLLLPFVPLTLQAQSPADPRPLLAGLRHGANVDSNASFAIGLQRPGDLTFRTDAFTGDALSISGRVMPESAHVGQVADIYTVVRSGDRFYTVDDQNRLAPWDTRVASLIPRHSNVTLEETEEFTLYEGRIDVAGDYRVFIGYRPQESGLLYYTPIAQPVTIAAAPVPIGECRSYGDRTVPVWHSSATGIFTHAPFAASDLSLITNGNETNDPRFSYQWVKSTPGATSVAPIDIYAPADGVLIRIRHKARNLPEFDGDDYDLFLLVACDPQRPDKTAIVRFNHITEPRVDIEAAYAFGELGAPEFQPVFAEHEERQVPLTNIVVRAGEWLGRTSGTPLAHDFDFMIAIDDASVCPFSVLDEPHRTQLLAMLGPKSASPLGPPQPGYACVGYGARP
ncbi:MAG: hypothetical protein ACO1PZ_10325 [Gammaproteobacteria bacterium]